MTNSRGCVALVLTLAASAGFAQTAHKPAFEVASVRPAAPAIQPRPVVDKTGLTGVYQFRIELDSDQRLMRLFRSAGVTTNVRGEPIDVPTGVSTFKAVESLGLKLERRRSPVPVVVVDRIERTPSDN